VKGRTDLPYLRPIYHRRVARGQQEDWLNGLDAANTSQGWMLFQDRGLKCWPVLVPIRDGLEAMLHP